MRTRQEMETDQKPAGEGPKIPRLGETIRIFPLDMRGSVAQSAYRPIGPLQTVQPDDPKTSFARVMSSRYRFRSLPGFRNILLPEAERMHAGRESATPGFRKLILGSKESSALAPD